jgi:hypothetical protein
MENDFSPKAIFENSKPHVEKEIDRIKLSLLKGCRYFPINHGIIFRVKKFFENAGWTVQKINGFDSLEFSCEEDEEEFLAKI